MGYTSIISKELVTKYSKDKTLARAFRSDFNLSQSLLIAYRNFKLGESYSTISGETGITTTRVGQIVRFYKHEIEPLIRKLERLD